MKIPNEVKNIIQTLKKHGFQAFIVGGCVRDLLRGVEPEDWDITTNAKPEDIQKIFDRNFYSNNFFTVTIKTDSENEKLKEIEITTFRKEAKYTDKRHPDEIKFAKTLEEDLERRDFTMNAIALELNGDSKNKEYRIIDLFNGENDIRKKIIRAVGDPKERFNEDALRMLRALRLATTLGFKIEEKTGKAIKENAFLLNVISKERIRDEFLKIIMSKSAANGVELLRQFGLLKYIMPEVEEGYGVEQNKHHIYDCYTHSLLSLDYAAKKDFNQNVRIAALLHDVGKPRVKRGEGPDCTFYNHEIIGTKMVFDILKRLKFPKKDIDKVVKLVRYHLFYYNVGEVSESAVRRLVRNVGKENIDELLQLRQADRIGSGVPKAEPYKLRHLRYIIEKVSQDPISVKMLKVNGNDVIEILKIKPGPIVGDVLDILLGYVLNNPEKNKRDILIEEIKKLKELSKEEIENLAKKAKKERELIETKRDEMVKKKYWVV